MAMELPGLRDDNCGHKEQDAAPDRDCDAEVAELRRQLAAQQADLSALHLELIAQKWQATGWQKQYHLLGSLLDAITHSWSWKLLAPVRALRSLVRPRVFTAADLIPGQDLQPALGGAPESLGLA